MRVLILGVGDAFTRRHFGTSALIEGPEGLVLLDCPDLVHRALHEAATSAGWNVKALDVHDIMLTHLHGDHCNGLESFGFAHRAARGRAGAGATACPRIHTSRPAAQRLWERLAPAMDGATTETPRTLKDFFDLRVLEPDRDNDVCGLTVRCRFARHPIPTLGLLVRDHHGTLGWSGDTSFDPDHIDWLSAADVIVHEANHPPVHTPVEKLEGLSPDLRRRIRLIHVPDDFESASTRLEPLRQGEVLEL